MRWRNAASSISGLPCLAHLARHLLGRPHPLLRLAQPCDAGAFVAEQELRHVPAAVLLVDAVLHRHAHVVEEHLVQVMAVVDRDDRPHRDARRLHVHQQERDALLPLRRVRIGADQHEAPVGVVRGRCPDLLPVHHVVVAVALRRGLQRGKVGSRARFGEPLAPPVVEVGGSGKKTLLLLLGAELDQHRAEHGDVERRQFRRRCDLVLLQEDHLLHRGPARAAPFLRPGHRRPAALVQDALPRHGVLLARAVAETHALADLGGKVVADEGAHLVAECLFFRGEAQVH